MSAGPIGLSVYARLFRSVFYLRLSILLSLPESALSYEWVPLIMAPEPEDQDWEKNSRERVIDEGGRRSRKKAICPHFS